MKRQVLGSLVVSLVATTLMTLSGPLSRGLVGSVSDLGFVLSFYSAFWIGFGLSSFVLVLLLSLLVHWVGAVSLRACIATGIAVGFFTVGLLNFIMHPSIPAHVEEGFGLLRAILIGALCGWLYWAIAIRESPYAEQFPEASPIAPERARHVKGVLAASLAAPFLGSLSIALADPPLERGLSSAIYITLETGAFILFANGLLLVLLFALLAALVNAAGQFRKPMALLCGAALGLGLTSLLFATDRPGVQTLLPGAALSGALCGWIYWRIAFHSTPRTATA